MKKIFIFIILVFVFTTTVFAREMPPQPVYLIHALILQNDRSNQRLEVDIQRDLGMVRARVDMTRAKNPLKEGDKLWVYVVNPEDQIELETGNVIAAYVERVGDSREKKYEVSRVQMMGKNMWHYKVKLIFRDQRKEMHQSWEKEEADRKKKEKARK